MMTRQEIQADLREIRYYYSMKEMFDKSVDTVKPLAIIEKVNRYNKVMETLRQRCLLSIFRCTCTTTRRLL